MARRSWERPKALLRALLMEGLWEGEEAAVVVVGGGFEVGVDEE